MSEIEKHAYDVLVIGAGGAGLRAAIAAREAGLRTAIICKSLFGKAHTVMAEGGIAAVDGQRQQQRQLAGALPRHHARRQVPQQLADGRAARQGGARPGLGARDLRRAVRPHQGRQDQPAQLRRPRVPAAGARRRPHRPGADPHAAAEDRLAAAGRPARARGDLRRAGSRSSPSAPSPTCSRDDVRARSPARSATTASRGRFVAVHARRRSSWPPAASASRSRSRRTRGSTPATGTRWPCAPARRCSTWSSSSSTRPAWSGRRRSRASWSPSRCAATAACCATPRASGSCSTTCPTSSGRSTPTPRTRPTAGTPTPTTTSAPRSCCRATRSPGRSTPR